MNNPEVEAIAKALQIKSPNDWQSDRDNTPQINEPGIEVDVVVGKPKKLKKDALGGAIAGMLAGDD